VATKKKTPSKGKRPLKKKQQAKKTRRKKQPSVKAVAYELLSRNPAEAKKYLKALELTRDTVLRLEKTLSGEAVPPWALVLVQEYRKAKKYPALGEGRGRSGPEVGEDHFYKAQQAADGGAPYVRMPLDTLGVDKGGFVKASFRKGSTTLVKATAAETAKARK